MEFEHSFNVDERQRKRLKLTLSPQMGRIAGSPLSLLKVVVSLVVIFFFGELLVMALLIASPIETSLIEALVDSVVLVLISSPLLYLYFYKPLHLHTETRKRAEEEIHLLSRQLLYAAEEEQRKLALDLHDEFGQSISALMLSLEEMQKKIQLIDPQLALSCAGPIARVDELHSSIRSLVARLRPGLLDGLGIEPALEWLVSELRRQNPEVEINLEISDLKTRPPQQVETVLFRISQEAISNALVHGKPRKIELNLTASYPDLILTIRDDGRGFDTTKCCHQKGGRIHFGLLSMRERTLTLNGRFSVTSQPDEGTAIRVVLPQKIKLDDVI